MTAVRRMLTAALLSLAATALFAQAPAPTPSAPRATDTVSAETDRDANDPRAMQLSLDSAVRTALQRNLGIELERYDYRIAGESLRREYGMFDWIADGTLAQSSTETAAATAFDASSERRTTFNVGVAQLLPTGGSYDLGFNNFRRTRAGFGTSFSPAYSSGLNFTFAQPLLRDFGIDITRRPINIARNTLGINREDFRRALMDTTVSVEQAYLDLVYARRAVEVVKESLFLARDQARITQIRIDVGASAPLDILQPRVTIATSEEQLILAVANVRDAEDRLRALLNLDPAEWDRPIIPTDPVEYEPMVIDMNEAVTRAFERRPELVQQALATDISRINYLYARNQVLPTLDLNLGYGVAGLGGRAIDPDTGNPDPDIPSTGYGNALEQLFQNDFPSWNVGVNFGVPILNIGARAEARRAELDLERSRQTDAQLRQNIAVEVRNYARAVDTSARSIVATRAAREAAERNLEAERRRYENGMTTNFQVLEVQQQLSDARVRELQALVGYNKAVSAYHRAVGDILEIRNIAVEEPAKVEEPQILNFFDRYNFLYYGNRINEGQEPKR